MSSKRANPILRSEAWGISLWATLAFAIGAMVVFWMLQNFVSRDIQQRSDAWLSGEVEVLGDVAGRTPKDRLYQRVVGEIAELASREVPNRDRSNANESDSVFFLQIGSDGQANLWVGAGDQASSLAAIRATKAVSDVPYDLHIKGFAVPFRVASVQIGDGSHIYLGLSEKDELRVLRNLKVRFLTLWFVIVLLGFLLVFYATWRMLSRVAKIAEAASRIGQSDLSSRVPSPKGNGEVGRLARTLNQMLDRIENTVGQLHTITDALAHDLRSPLTAIRGKMEAALSPSATTDPTERIVSAIDELDRLSNFLNTTLDVSEARADALRLSRTEIDLASLVRAIAEFFEPSISEKGLALHLRIAEPATILADAALLHRVIANLLDNELKHLPPSSTVWLSVHSENDMAVLTIEDDGPGFDPEVARHLFERRVKGRASRGYGLGLAFVQAVIRVHGGTVEAANRVGGGAQISLALPILQSGEHSIAEAAVLVNG
jgi:signal transduction histidine kinase